MGWFSIQISCTLYISHKSDTYWGFFIILNIPRCRKDHNTNVFIIIITFKLYFIAYVEYISYVC